MKHYGQRDPRALGKHYTNHLQAMTTEALHAKSDIACELALRDSIIEMLRRALSDLVQVNEQHNESIAAVMGRPPGWCDDYLDASRKALERCASLFPTDEPT